MNISILPFVPALTLIAAALGLNACSSTPPQYQAPTNATSLATVTVKLDVPPKTLLGPKRFLNAYLLDQNKVISGEGCTSKQGLLGKKYGMDINTVLLGSIATKYSEPTKTLPIEANKSYIVSMQYTIVRHNHGVYSKNEAVDFTPKPNTKYVLAYKEVKTKHGHTAGGFQFFIDNNGRLIEAPENQIKPATDFNCEAYLTSQGDK